MKEDMNMKELYNAPEVKLIGFVASEKIAAEETLGFGGLKVSLNDIITPSGEDVKLPVSLT